MGTKKKSKGVRRNSSSKSVKDNDADKEKEKPKTQEKEKHKEKENPLDCKPLIDSIESTVHLLTNTYSLVDKFHSDAQEDLIDNLAKLIQSYKSVDEHRNVFGDRKVPMDILDHLDRPGKQS